MRDHLRTGLFARWWVAGSVGGWLAPSLAFGFTLVWCLMIYFLIGERIRDWQYGVVPYIPGQSILSTEPLTTGPVPDQVELPLAARSRMRGM